MFFCDVSIVESRIVCHTELPLFTRNTFHVIGKYDHNRVYIVHRVYICLDLKPPCVVQLNDHLEGCNNNHHGMSCFHSVSTTMHFIPYH
jgi:hypothetical protein